MDLLKNITQNLVVGDAPSVRELTKRALSEDIKPLDILNKALIPGMNVVGIKFKNNEFFLPEVLIAARAMNAGMEIISPILAESGIKPTTKIGIGTVEGDLHDIGKNIVIVMLRGAGFEVKDLGVDVPTRKFIEFVNRENPQILGLSALLTTTMLKMREVINAIRDENLKVKVIIGGAPVTPKYAKEIGAYYAPDAVRAVELVNKLLH